MKLVQAVVRNAVALTAVFSVSLGSNAVLAQDSAFLACARHTDRGQRIACLEDALDAAVAAQQGNQATAPPPAPARTPVPEVAEAPPVPAQNPAPPPANSTPATPAVTTVEPEERTSLLDRIRAFGQDDEEASISTDASGKDRLHDTITALEKRNELWTVTLSSGQVWRQVFPRTLNLRVGDEISVYQEGIGEGYRLATPRLSGFIRVERSK